MLSPDAVGSGSGADWTNAYTSLSAAESDNDQDLTAGPHTLIIHCKSSSGSTDDTAVDFAGWTCDASSYITVIVDEGDRSTNHGKWDATKYRLEISELNGIYITDAPYTRIEGLQIEVATTSGSTHYLIVGHLVTGTQISYCLGRHNSDTAGTRVGFAFSAGDVFNCIVYNVIGGSGRAFRAQGGGNNTNFIYNCTAVDCGTGFQEAYLDATVKNCVAFNCTTDYDGAWQAASTNNAYDNADPEVMELIYQVMQVRIYLLIIVVTIFI